MLRILGHCHGARRPGKKIQIVHVVPRTGHYRMIIRFGPDRIAIVGLQGLPAGIPPE